MSTPHTPGSLEDSPAQPSHVAGQVGSEKDKWDLSGSSRPSAQHWPYGPKTLMTAAPTQRFQGHCPWVPMP